MLSDTFLPLLKYYLIEGTFLVALPRKILLNKSFEIGIETYHRNSTPKCIVPSIFNISLSQVNQRRTEFHPELQRAATSDQTECTTDQMVSATDQEHRSHQPTGQLLEVRAVTDPWRNCRTGAQDIVS
jgi:hypothetical protein